MNNASKILLAVGVGVAIGAALGVLYAPHAGSVTRRKIIKNGKKLAGTVNDGIDDGAESLADIKDVLQRQLTKVNRRLEAYKL